MVNVKPFEFKELSNYVAKPMSLSEFDMDADPRDLLPEPPPPPTFSEEELNAKAQKFYEKGLAEGHKKGFDEGHEKGKGELIEVEKLVAAAIPALSQKMEKIDKAIADSIEQQKSGTVKLALAIAKKVAGAALKEDPLAKIEEVAGKCLTHLTNESNITITVHSSLSASIEEKIKTITGEKGLKSAIKISAEENIPATDCRIEWENGEAKLNVEEVWVTIEKVLEDNLK